MSNYLASDTDLTSVADAIRAKGGTSAQLAFPAGFVQAIADIPSGGGGIRKATGSFTIIVDGNNNQPTIAHNLGTQKIAVVIYPVSISASTGYQMFYISFVNVPAVVDSGVWSLDFRSYNSAKIPDIVYVDPQNSSDNSHLKTVAMQDSPWQTQNQWYSAANTSREYSNVELTNDTFRTKYRWATGSYKWVAFALE